MGPCHFIAQLVDALFEVLETCKLFFFDSQSLDSVFNHFEGLQKGGEKKRSETKQVESGQGKTDLGLDSDTTINLFKKPLCLLEIVFDLIELSCRQEKLFS